MTDRPIACIKQGRSTIQGELIHKGLEMGTMIAKVLLDGKIYTGELVTEGKE